MVEKLFFIGAIAFTVAFSLFNNRTSAEKTAPPREVSRVSGYVVGMDAGGSTLLFRVSDRAGRTEKCIFDDPDAAKHLEAGEAVTVIGTPHPTDDTTLTNCSIK